MSHKKDARLIWVKEQSDKGLHFLSSCHYMYMGVQWLSGRVLDSRGVAGPSLTVVTVLSP